MCPRSSVAERSAVDRKASGSRRVGFGTLAPVPATLSPDWMRSETCRKTGRKRPFHGVHPAGFTPATIGANRLANPRV